jgi:hypothetical protein
MGALGSALSFGIWQNWGLGTVAPDSQYAPVIAQGANQSPTRHVAIASLMPEVQPAPGMRKRFLTTVLRESGRTSGALVVKAQEFAPLHHLARYTT